MTTDPRRPRFDVVVPTVGRPSLDTLLRALASGAGALPGTVFVVDDRRDDHPGDGRGEGRRPLWSGSLPPRIAPHVRVLRGRATGPAAARNAGWRASTADWVAFLDDDVVPAAGWLGILVKDLEAAERLGPDVAGSQGRIRVPLPRGRRPTDWERNVAALETAVWATADLAYRRAALEAVGGFDERFRRAYREDADLGLRLVAAGWRIVAGERIVTHPVRPADPWVSVRLQAGNADDAVMRALHGRAWQEHAGVAQGRRPWHLLTAAAALAGIAGLAAGRHGIAMAGLGGYLAGATELAWARIAPGPRTPAEMATMLATSAVLPAAASWHWLAGCARVHRSRWQARLVDLSSLAATESTHASTDARSQLPGGCGRPARVLSARDRSLEDDGLHNGDVSLAPSRRARARRTLDGRRRA
jgi:glycosyl transferase family 2